MLVWYQLWFGPRAISDNLLSLSFAFNLVPSMHEGIVWASWTIGVEMIFYAMLPFFLSIATARISALGLALIAVAVSAVGRMYLEELPNNYAHMAFISNLGAFCLGIFAYRLFSHSTDRVRDSRIAWVATLAFAVPLARAAQEPSSARQA
jgi:peptidoglycan/LPS O-acetylase OafA/YrhL